MKTCKGCNKEKDSSCFSIVRAKKDGLEDMCRVCKVDFNAKRRLRYIDSIRMRDRKRNKLPHRVKAKGEYCKTETFKKIAKLSQKKWQKANPEKTKAHAVVRDAIKDGVLEREPCQICGNKKSHGHHEDYNEPLDVIWLCQKHHYARHRELSEEKRRA